MFLLKIRDNDRGGHGDKFKAKMKEINEATCPDLQVTSYGSSANGNNCEVTECAMLLSAQYA